MTKPLILVTNDDGISAPGIRSLIQITKDFGDVVVVAPNKPQSGMGHAITLESGLICEKVIIDKGSQIEYACSGTPVDCVKLGIHELLDRKPDLCVSGINHGSNSSINVIYSGTMAAAIEASLEGVPSLGFSILDFDHNSDLKEAEVYVRMVIEQVLKTKIDTPFCLNVNIPKLNKRQAIKGFKLCRQANANWAEEFEKKIDNQGKVYYYLKGKFINYDNGIDTDEWALKHHYVSVVPVKFDLTDYSAIKVLKHVFND